MNSFKKMLRLLALIALMALATIGIGLGGGIPVQVTKRKEDHIEIKTEENCDPEHSEGSKEKIKV